MEENTMTKQEFWAAHDKALEAIRWAILSYFGQEAIDKITELRAKEDVMGCLAFHNDVWFHLPDGRFNIIENPPGWHTFLSFLEGEAMEPIEE